MMVNPSASSAASKREHFYQNADEYRNALLPIHDSIFHNGNPSQFPKTVTITQFLSPNFSCSPADLGLSSNAYMVVIQSILGRITDFRRTAELEGIQVFDGRFHEKLNASYQSIEKDLSMFYNRLPEEVKLLDQGVINGQWSIDHYDWILVLIVYHSTFTSFLGYIFINKRTRVQYDGSWTGYC